jgi:hypothetical protein
MSESEEERGFVIRDRRGRSEPEAPPSPSPSSKTSSGSSVNEAVNEAASKESSQAPSPPVSFSSFVFSLGTSSLMLMGEQLDPQQPAPPVNLPQAKEIIDILSMLEEKTKNNLSSDEASVLGDMLYTLRMKYVSLTSGKGSILSS